MPWLWGKKSKLDNLYRSSNNQDHCRTATTILPLFIGPMNGCHIQARTHESPRKVPNYTAWWTEAHWCEQLAQGCCPTMQRPGIEPMICPSWVQCPNHYTTEPPVVIHSVVIHCTRLSGNVTILFRFIHLFVVVNELHGMKFLNNAVHYGLFIVILWTGCL